MEPRILIIGGGIGGLTLGALLRKRGLHPDIIEATPEWKPVGAGITLGINAMRIYRELGAEAALLERGRVLEEACITDARGRVLSRMDFRGIAERHGASLAIHRAELHTVLAVFNPGARLGTTVSSIEDTGDEMRVTFCDDMTASYDLVIGADGIHSTTRESVCGDSKYRYSGYTCWRFIVEVDPPPAMTSEMWGPGRRFGVVPLSGSTVYCFSTLNSAEKDMRWDSLTLEGYRDLFGDFGGDVPRILDALRSDDQLIHNDLAEIRVPRWAKNRVALLGDAAHAMTPNMGQGAAMAIEDAWVLDQEIAALGPVPDALTVYEARRRGRVETIQRRSWTIGRIGQLANPLGTGMRNLAVKMSPDKAAAGSIEKLLTAQI